MHLIRHADLRIAIAVKLTVAKPSAQRTLGMVQNSDKEAVLDAIMSTIAGCVIVRPDIVRQQQAGQFGVSEPHPFPELLTGEERDAIAAALASPPQGF